jgi:hypothetical protein
MSSVFFDGNTYTFGATVSANPGTGTTSYVFGGLSSGATFGFILRAFNGFGFSNFVGPVTKITLSEIPEEERTIIAALEWNTPYYAISTYNKYVDPIEINNTNLFISSTNLTPITAGGTWWTTDGNIPVTPPMSITTGHTAPDGSTTAWAIQSSAVTGWSISKSMNLEKGFTYYLSFYYDHSRGTTGNLSYPNMYLQPTSVTPGIEFVPKQQILPVVGIMTTSSSEPALPGTSTGWTRYAFQFNSSFFDLDRSLVFSGLFAVPSGNSRGVSTCIRYYWGPQLEKAT